MRVSKDFIASLERKGNFVVSAKKVSSDLWQKLENIKGFAKEHNANNIDLVNEVTALGHLFTSGEPSGTFEEYEAALKLAIEQGEFVKAQSTQKADYAKKPQEAQAPRAEAQTQGGEKKQSAFDPQFKPITQEGEEMSAKFYEFQKTNINKKGFSVAAINNFTRKRNYFVGQADNGNAMFEQADKELAEIANQIEKGTFGKSFKKNATSDNAIIAEAVEKFLKTDAGKEILADAVSKAISTNNHNNKERRTSAKKEFQNLDEAIVNEEIWTYKEEVRKKWAKESVNGVFQHILNDYNQLTALAKKQPQDLQEFKASVAKLEAEIRADAQNPKRAETAAKNAQKAQKPQAQAPRANAVAETQEPSEVAEKKFEAEPKTQQFGDANNPTAMNTLRKEAPINNAREQRVGYRIQQKA